MPASSRVAGVLRQAGVAGMHFPGLRYAARNASILSSNLARTARHTSQGFLDVKDLTAPLPSAMVRHAHSSSAREAVNMNLKGMAPSNRGEYVVTKLDDCTFAIDATICTIIGFRNLRLRLRDVVPCRH
jgi:hypothetical protein